MTHAHRNRRSTSRWILKLDFACLVIAALTTVFATTATALIVIAMSACCIVVVLAWSPAFVCVGTKTVMARGAFGLRTVQHLKGSERLVIPRWRLLDRLFDVGAASVCTPDGQRVFVPFISNARSLAQEAKNPPRPDLVEETVTDEERAEARRRLSAFVEGLDDE